MRSLDAAELAGIQQRSVVARVLGYVIARPFGGGAPVAYGFSNLVRNLTIPVIDGRTGALVSDRVFVGIGGAFKVPSIPLTADIAVRAIDIELPAIDANVANMLRGYDVRGAPIQIHRVYLDPDTHNQLAPAKPRFVGYIDGAPIETPAAGGSGRARITCVSTTRELTRANPDVRSHESQLARTGGADDFYIDTAVVANWEIFWGQAGKGGNVGGGFAGGLGR